MRIILLLAATAMTATAAQARDSDSGAARAAAAWAPGFFDISAYCPAQVTLGGLPNGSGTQAYKLPAAIAGNAAWIQIFVELHSGGGNTSGERTYKISTEPKPFQPVQYYISSFGYDQPAWSYNSDNLWLPAPAGGSVEAMRTEGAPWGEHWGSELRLIGYLRRDRGKPCV